MKVVWLDFLSLLFGFVIFEQKEINAKAARKMLVNLTAATVCVKDCGFIVKNIDTKILFACLVGWLWGNFKKN